MKFRFFFTIIFLASLCGCGTVHGIKSMFTAPPPAVAQDVQIAPATAKPPGVFSRFTAPKNLTPPAPTISSPALVTATPVETIRATINYELRFMWLAAALLAIGAGICAYMQNYFVAIKLGCAALALPICATFFSLFWGWIIACSLVGGAVFIFLHYKMVLLPAIASAAGVLKKI